MATDLLLTYDFPPLGGGIARWMEALARHYAPDELVVLTGGHPEGGDPDEAAVVDAGIPGPVDRVPGPRTRLRNVPGLIRWGRKGVSWARERAARFTWCGNVRPATHPAWWIRLRTGTPYGVVAHGKDLLELGERLEGSAWMRWIMPRLLAPARVYVANSEWTADLWRDALGAMEVDAPRERVRVIPLGTDPERFRPGLATPGIRRRYGMGEGRWLVTVARLLPHKGIDTAIRAVARLAPERPGLRYAVVGTGRDRERLEGLAAELGVGDRVRFLGAVPDDDLPAVVSAADVYVGLSRREPLEVEGFGIALVEGSACGLPVVGGASGGVPDAVRDGETGLLVAPGDPEAAAGALRRILDDPELARALGRGGRRAVEEFYNWGRVAREMRDLARELGRR